MQQPEKILYSIYKNIIIIRLNQGNNTVESRDLIQTKTKEALSILLEIDPEAQQLPLLPDKTGELNLLIYVVPYASVNAFAVELDTHPDFVRKNNEKEKEKTDIDELEMLLSGMYLEPEKFGGGYRKSNKSSKSKKYKTTKNKKNKKPTKRKKTKKNKKTRR